MVTMTTRFVEEGDGSSSSSYQQGATSTYVGATPTTHPRIYNDYDDVYGRRNQHEQQLPAPAGGSLPNNGPTYYDDQNDYRGWTHRGQRDTPTGQDVPPPRYQIDHHDHHSPTQRLREQEGQKPDTQMRAKFAAAHSRTHYSHPDDSSNRNPSNGGMSHYGPFNDSPSYYNPSRGDPSYHDHSYYNPSRDDPSNGNPSDRGLSHAGPSRGKHSNNDGGKGKKQRKKGEKREKEGRKAPKNLSYAEIIEAIEDDRITNSRKKADSLTTTKSLLDEYMKNHHSNREEKSEIPEVNVNDFICGRTSLMRYNPGNAQYDDLINLIVCVYAAATRDEKPQIAIEIYRLITTKMNPRGRFLKVVKDGSFEEFIVAKALSKIRKDLRMGAVSAVNSGLLENFSDAMNVKRVKARVAARKKQRKQTAPSLREIQCAGTANSLMPPDDCSQRPSPPQSRMGSPSIPTNKKREAHSDTYDPLRRSSLVPAENSNMNRATDDDGQESYSPNLRPLSLLPGKRQKYTADIRYTDTLTLKTLRVNVALGNDKKGSNLCLLATVPATFLKSGKAQDCDGATSENLHSETVTHGDRNTNAMIPGSSNQHVINAFDNVYKSSLRENHGTTCSEITASSCSLSYQFSESNSLPPSTLDRINSSEDYDNINDEVKGTNSGTFGNSIDTIYCGKCLGTGILPVPPELKKFSSDTNDYDGNTLKKLIKTEFLPATKDQATDDTNQNNRKGLQSPPQCRFGLAEIIEAEKKWEIIPREDQSYTQRIDAIEEKALRAREYLEAQNQKLVNIAAINNIDSILTKHIEQTELKWGIIPPENSTLDDRLLRIKEAAKYLRDGLQTTFPNNY